MSHKEKIQQAFNRAALSYDAYSEAQTQIATRLLQLLKPYHFSNPCVIDLGCGTGAITQKLAEQISFRELHAIDIAQSLLAIAKTRLTKPNIKVYSADFDLLPHNELSFDLIFSNMALQWSEDLPTTLEKLTQRLTPQGILAFSIPITGTFKELTTHYSCRPFINAAVFQQKIKELGCFSKIVTEKITPRFNHTLDALRSIKNVGATYVAQRNHKGLLGKSLLKNTLLHTLTYHIGYFLLRPTPL